MGPEEILFNKTCNAGNALMTNQPEYFHSPEGGDPCLPETDKKVKTLCKTNKNTDIFRTANGECNNKYKPRWGSANSRFERILPAEFNRFDLPTYDDLSKFRKEIFLPYNN